MAIEDIFEGGLGTGLAVGIGVAVLGPLLRPVATGVLRPALKAVIRGGIYVYDAGRETVAQINEKTGDMVAEARAEMDAAPRPASAKRSAGQHPSPAG